MKQHRALGCGDADGDGFGDVLWYHEGHREGVLWVTDGEIEMELSFALPELERGWKMEASGDFDGDGLANEVLVRETTTGVIEFWDLVWDAAQTDFSIASTPAAATVSGDWQVIGP
jgi:hypothetical protein